MSLPRRGPITLVVCRMNRKVELAAAGKFNRFAFEKMELAKEIMT